VRFFKGSDIPEIFCSTDSCFIAYSYISKASRAGGATCCICTGLPTSRGGKNAFEGKYFVLRKIKPGHVIVIDGLLLILLSNSALYVSVLQHSDSVENIQTDLNVKPVLPRNVVVGTYLKYINKIQQDATVCRYLFTAKSLYMFRVSFAVIRSA